VQTADIRLSVVNSAGTVTDTEIVSDVAGYLNTPDVAALTDGRFVIIWADTTTDDLAGRIYDPATGAFSGAEFVVSNGASFQETPQVAALPDGGFIVTWTDNANTLGDASEEAIHGRRFDASGAFAGDEFLVNTATAGSQNSSALAVNAAGTIFVGWTDSAATNPFSTDTAPDRIEGQFFKPLTEVVNGTAADDTIATYSLAETINGLAGNDAIDARGGDDIVSGGEGKDGLTGGLGADGFRFDVKLKGKNVDHVTDFTPGVDSLVLDHAIFKKFKVGDLKTSAFFAGNKVDDGKDDKDLVVYDKKSGKVFYDADGPGGADAKLVAILDGSPNKLKASDIEIVA
jgi:Ca2+-binding RTX toxin-like protein